MKDGRHMIKIFTSRNIGCNNEKVSIVTKKYFLETYKFLKKWNIKFDKLIAENLALIILLMMSTLNIKSKTTIDLLEAINE